MSSRVVITDNKSLTKSMTVQKKKKCIYRERENDLCNFFCTHTTDTRRYKSAFKQDFLLVI